ncbi:MAG: FKBP-type peptidyl-prolyl cis-trans isomerase N-terminal domain-containing protein [Candidatus Onthomorpha sp.]
MKRISLFKSLSLVVCAAVGFGACSQKTQRVDLGELKTLEDSVSYVLGLSEGMGMKAQGVEVNPEIFIRAYQQGYASDTAGVMSMQQMQEVMQKYQTKMMEKQQAKAAQDAVPYRQAAEKFLEQNKTADGVKTTASGLQYKVVKEGKGVKPTSSNDRVRIQYSLSVLGKDGKISQPIEDTFQRGGEPVIFAMNGLIKGMEEGLSMMNAGAVYDFWISPDLGYGDYPSDMIPAGSLLVFHVEMVEVLPAQTK